MHENSNMGKDKEKGEKERRAVGKGEKDKEEIGRRKREKKIRTMGKGNKGYGEKGKRDTSHSLMGVGGYVGLTQGFVKYSQHLN